MHSSSECFNRNDRNIVRVTSFIRSEYSQAFRIFNYYEPFKSDALFWSRLQWRQVASSTAHATHGMCTQKNYTPNTSYVKCIVHRSMILTYICTAMYNMLCAMNRLNLYSEPTYVCANYRHHTCTKGAGAMLCGCDSQEHFNSIIALGKKPASEERCYQKRCSMQRCNLTQVHLIHSHSPIVNGMQVFCLTFSIKCLNHM